MKEKKDQSSVCYYFSLKAIGTTDPVIGTEALNGHDLKNFKKCNTVMPKLIMSLIQRNKLYLEITR